MIPNIFHFIFGLREQDEPFHLIYYLCLKSCIHANKPDAVNFHFANEPWGPWWDRIKPSLQLRKIKPNKFVSEFEYVDKAIERYRYAHHADFLRLEILRDEGGIYADIDTLFLENFPQEWLARDFILGAEKPAPGTSGSLCNAWIAAQPNAEFCRLWLDEMEQAFDGSWSNHSTQLPFLIARRRPDLLSVEPEASFYALDYSAEGINDLFMRSVKLPDNAYSLHLWNHLWFDKKRKDFSVFHSDALTVDYVRHANSTYAEKARRYLPEDCRSSKMAYHLQRAGLQGPEIVKQAVRRLLKGGL